MDPSLWASILETSRAGTSWPLTLIGPVGSGKTCAALCLLDRASGRGQRQYLTVSSLCEKLIEVQNGREEYAQSLDNPRWWWERYARGMSCVVLDELGARNKVSDFQYETVKRAIDERAGKPLVLVSNLGINHLAEVYDDRIASRIAGGTVLTFPDTDRRLAP